MAHYVGLDVSLEETSICVVDEDGHKVWQGKTSSRPEAIAKVIDRRASEAIKIGLEAGPMFAWHWHSLNEMGLPVVCLDARHAKAALSMQVKKTDANDAEGLAQIVCTGWYREVKVKSMDSHLIRSLIIARSQLVGMKVQIWSRLKAWGIKLMKRSGGKEAKVAVARKLAVIMHRMWGNGTDFRWSEKVAPV